MNRVLNPLASAPPYLVVSPSRHEFDTPLILRFLPFDRAVALPINLP